MSGFDGIVRCNGLRNEKCPMRIARRRGNDGTEVYGREESSWLVRCPELSQELWAIFRSAEMIDRHAYVAKCVNGSESLILT